MLIHHPPSDPLGVFVTALVLLGLMVLLITVVVLGHIFERTRK